MYLKVDTEVPPDFVVRIKDSGFESKILFLSYKHLMKVLWDTYWIFNVQ